MYIYILCVCVHVTETPPVSMRLPSGSFSDPQTGAPESARLVACFLHQRVCVPLDAAVAPCDDTSAQPPPPLHSQSRNFSLRSPERTNISASRYNDYCELTPGKVGP